MMDYCSVPVVCLKKGVFMSKLQENNVANERVYTVEEIAKLARISRTGAYELIKRNTSR